MSVLSRFKANYPYDRSPHGILMRYLQNFRYFAFLVTVLWFMLVLYFRLLNSTFSMPKFVIIVTFSLAYLLSAEITLFRTYSKCPESAETLIKLFGIADITIITAGVFMSGGAFSPFVLLYLFPLANFRIIYGHKGSFTVAGICLTAYFLALGVSSELHPLQIINFLAVVVPFFLAFTYYLGVILVAERDSRAERVKLSEAYKKSRLLYELSKEVNRTTDFDVLCNKVYEAVNPVIPVRGIKVFFDVAQQGHCSEIFSMETEQIEWSVNLDGYSGEEISPEVLRSTNCDCGFFVLPLGVKTGSGLIVIRGGKDDLQPDYYEEYLKTVAEITAAGFQNAVTLKRLELQSVSDGLTGLLNNHCFFKRLDELIAQAERYRIKFAVAMLDIDRFKNINDTYGHLFGDTVLKKCAGIVREAVRGSDLVARYGGEEFGIIMPHTDLPGACKLMERVRRLIEAEELKGEGISCGVTVSIGVCGWAPGMTGKDIVRLADMALYSAKNHGRNRVVSEGAGSGLETG